MIYKEHISLAPLTTFAVGGNARFFVEAHGIDDIQEARAFAKEHSLPIFVLGGGSNILIADEGFSGVVVRMTISHITHEQNEDRITLMSGAGAKWDTVVAYAVERGFVGLECLSGIPGTVGGAVVANLGAYGAQCSDSFIDARVIPIEGDAQEMKTITNRECGFSYHNSNFNKPSWRYAIVEARFSITASGTSHASYKDNRFNLGALAEKIGREPSPKNVRDEVIRMRREKGTLEESFKGAGSFFHMPFVSEEKYHDLVAEVCKRDAEKEERLRPWAWAQSDGTYKIAPGFLLEYTEFEKGYTRGSVGISPKHTLTIINRGGARASDIAQLARDMQNAVATQFGINLEREVEYVGNVENNP